jgi:polysaccharide pyruvyl transferase WcaK-like protein
MNSTKTFSFTGYYGNKNLGDELLLANVVNYIQNIDKAVTFQIFTYNAPIIQNENNFSCKLIEKKNLKNPINFIKVLLKIIKSDLYIFTGGAIFSEKNIIQSSIFIFIASFFNTKVIILPVGIAPIKNYKHWLLKLLWSNVKYVSVRDYTSYENIEWYSKVEVKPDVAFLPKPKKIVLTNKVEFIGLNPRNVTVSTNKKIIDYFLKLAAKFGNNPVFYIYSTSIGQKNSQDDYDICLTLQRKLNESGFKTEYVCFKNVEEFIKFQSKLDFNFACRLHAFLESLTLGIPSFILKIDEIPKINSIIEFLKFEDLMLDINMKPNLISVFSTNFDEINKRVLCHHNDITTTFEKLITHA